MMFRRNGECQHCGNCCKLLKGMDCFPTWLKKEFPWAHQNYVETGRNGNRCYFYNRKAQPGHPACRIHGNADRLRCCAEFPATPEQAQAFGCPGFQFVEDGP